MVTKALLTMWMVATAPAAEPGAPAGRVAGRVLDAEGRPVVGATVILCDGESGIPVGRNDYRPFNEKGPDPDGVVTCLTDAEGRFAFEGISRRATYRVFAQSWPDAVEPAGKPIDVHGEIVALHGAAAEIDPHTAAAGRVELRPLGDATLTIDQKFGNDETLLLISRSPQIADPILGFHAWGPAHLTGLIGYNRMPKGRTTIRGLPAGPVYLSVFSADNNPGFGHLEVDAARRTAAGETAPVAASIVAGWSDARHTPPDRLAPLCKEIASGQLDVQAAIGLSAEQTGAIRGLGEAIARVGPLDREIVLPDGRRTTVGDLMACEGYNRLISRKR